MKLIKGKLYTYPHVNEDYTFYFIFDEIREDLIMAQDGYVQHGIFYTPLGMCRGTSNLRESTKEEIEIYNQYAPIKYRERRIYEIY